MKQSVLFLFYFLMLSSMIMGQSSDSTQAIYKNTADNLISRDSRLTIGGYGEVHYNQPINKGTSELGKLDVHRVVMLFGYKFNDRTQFITELEFEHVKEVYVEQAFLQYKVNNFMNIRAGLMLTPMGIINEYHEPTTFNGVERPHIDKYISPSTWREVGIGLQGNIAPSAIKYQVYIMNGFNGYDTEAKFNGKNGLRSGRQKGAESYIVSPNFTAKVEYYGIRGLNVGLSGYFGKSQSKLYSGLDKSIDNGVAIADSSVIGMAMVGLDARYRLQGFIARGQFYYNNLSNTDQYNAFSGSNDLGSAMMGYYVDLGYNVFQHTSNLKSELIPFVRYEQFNTHAKVEVPLVANDAYNVNVITSGLSWKITPGSIVKADMQFVKSKADDKSKAIFNAGIGVMF